MLTTSTTSSTFLRRERPRAHPCHRPSPHAFKTYPQLSRPSLLRHALLHSDFLAENPRAQRAAWDLLQVVPFLSPACSITVSLAFMEVLDLSDSMTTLLCVLPWLIMHVIGPAFDLVVGPNPLPMQDVEKTSPWTRLVPFLYTLPQAAAEVLGVTAAGVLWSTQGPDAVPQLLLLMLCLGMSCAVGMGSSHELVHSRHPLHQVAVAQQMAWCHLWPYTKFHHHHHLHVGTPEDPVSADKGESLYQFFPKYLRGIYQTAWEMEAAEAVRRGRSVWDPKNQMLQGMALQTGLVGLSYLLGGWAGVWVHLVTGSIGVIYLGAMDYALHYGLKREKQANGVYDPVTPYTSYNSGYMFENSILCRVLLHSDHHMTASKPYDRLGMEAGNDWPLIGPSCPCLALSLAVFFPSLWGRLMDDAADRANAAHKAYVSKLKSQVDAA